MLVHEDTLRVLAKGSYEERISRVTELIEQLGAVSGRKLYVIATFDDHALVCEEASKFYWIGLEKEDSNLVVSDVSEATIPFVGIKEAKALSREAISAFLDNNYSAFSKKSHQVDSLLTAIEEDCIQTISNTIYASNLWKRALSGDRLFVESCVGSLPAPTKISSASLAFSRLGLDKQASFVQSSTRSLKSYLDSFVSQFSEASNVPESFEVLKADALGTVRVLVESLGWALDNVGNGALLQIHNMVVDVIPPLEVFSRYLAAAMPKPET